ncbi:MAG: hypothetical protein EHM24_26535 [Acidobacteria bacterium]|nr:MAG: hypothetical protein EHM24_26535 [Acidobacteriota bacterium]RPJ84435.1 MAG: hypothetical protein EHM13_04305 [Acidobacteriota bacterium]
MDDLVKRLARELSEAIAAAVERDPGGEACRAKAKAAGFELQVSLEAVVGLAGRTGERPAAASRVPIGARPAAAPCRPFEMSAADRRFLRSLRIAADETPEEV